MAMAARRSLAALAARSSRRFGSAADGKAGPRHDLALFWDASSVGIGSGPAAASHAVLRELRSRGRMVERRVYLRGDTAERGDFDSEQGPEPSLSRSLEQSGFVVVRCQGPDAVGRRLSVDLLNFAWSRASLGQPGIVGLVSGDADYAYLLHKVRDLGLETIVLCPDAARDASGPLCGAADVVLDCEAPAAAAPEARPMRAYRSSAGQGLAAEPPQAAPAAPAVAEAPWAPASDVCFEEVLRDAAPWAPGPAEGAVEGQVEGKLQCWGDLSLEARAAAGALGYDAASWDAGETPDESAREWAILGPRERAAAAQLGRRATSAYSCSRPRPLSLLHA